MAQGNAFGFWERPERTAKPRKLGITCATDRNFSLRQCEDIVETAGDIIDHMKIHDHVGVMWRWDLEWMQKKNAYIIEAMRHGLNRGIDYEYFYQFQGKNLPPAEMPPGK
ncbi:MAG: phosphosulfolactate synthase [Proteobacteria bacterium]|nr:phosphosulfolactate synthase [Pseudomonadota bacterium]